MPEHILYTSLFIQFLILFENTYKTILQTENI